MHVDPTPNIFIWLWTFILCVCVNISFIIMNTSLKKIIISHTVFVFEIVDYEFGVVCIIVDYL